MAKQMSRGGFLFKKSSLQNNIKEDSIVSKRIIKDHMHTNNLKPYTSEITNDLNKSYRDAYSRYKIHLEEEK